MQPINMVGCWLFLHFASGSRAFFLTAENWFLAHDSAYYKYRMLLSKLNVDTRPCTLHKPPDGSQVYSVKRL